MQTSVRNTPYNWGHRVLCFWSKDKMLEHVIRCSIRFPTTTMQQSLSYPCNWFLFLQKLCDLSINCRYFRRRLRFQSVLKSDHWINFMNTDMSQIFYEGQLWSVLRKSYDPLSWRIIQFSINFSQLFDFGPLYKKFVYSKKLLRLFAWNFFWNFKVNKIVIQ